MLAGRNALSVGRCAVLSRWRPEVLHFPLRALAANTTRLPAAVQLLTILLLFVPNISSFHSIDAAQPSICILIPCCLSFILSRLFSGFALLDFSCPVSGSSFGSLGLPHNRFTLRKSVPTCSLIHASTRPQPFYFLKQGDWAVEGRGRFARLSQPSCLSNSIDLRFRPAL